MTLDHQTENRAGDVERKAHGLLTFAVVAGLSGVIAWIALPAGTDRSADVVNPGTVSVSALAAVDAADTQNAVSTMSGTPESLGRYERRYESCSAPLAWVSIQSAPGEPPALVRLRSGDYISPAVETSPVPVRLAIPYPAPYESGRGELTVMGGSALISLQPSWLTQPQADGQTHAVTWSVTDRCRHP